MLTSPRFRASSREFSSRTRVPPRTRTSGRTALGHAQLLDGAGAGRGDLVLHLHGLDHADERALVHLRALLYRHPQHRALDRRDELARRPAATAALLLAPRRLLGR